MFTDEYFERQLQIIREIRLSERKFYQKITDLYATAFDYDKDAKTTRRFFQTVQNKILYLDYAELQAERQIPISMEDWATRLDGFLEFNGNEVLTDAGKISAEQAKLHAETEFEKYRIVQDIMFISDYDKFLLELEEQTKNKSDRVLSIDQPWIV